MKKQSIYLGLSVILFTHVALAQQPGDLDVTFGINGFSTIDIDGQGLFDRVSKIALQPDGKIAFAGGIRNASGTQSDLFFGRVNVDGDLDQGFGANGTIIMDMGGDNESVAGIGIDANGRILFAGTSDQIGVYEHLLLQLTENGDLDLTFGDDGIIYNSPLMSGSVVTSFTTDNEGNLFVTGTGNGDVMVVKYLPTGYPDDNFGTSGTVIHDLGSVDETATRCIVQDDGRILIAGSQVLSSDDALIVRLLQDGSLDQSFNQTGWVNLELSPWIDRINGMVLLPDGKLLVVGNVSDQIGSDNEIFAVQIKSDGSYDTTFGTEGLIRYDIGVGSDFANVVVLQPDGKVIIGGGTNDNSTIQNENFCLVRLNDDGSLDQSFGNNGIVVTEISSSYERVIDMALQDDGKLIVVGTAKVGLSEDVAFARYHTGLNISVSEIFEDTRFLLYPNPVTETLSVSADRKLRSVELLDALGRTVLTTRTINADHLQLNLSDLTDGIYLLRASDGKQMISQKVIKR